MDELNSCFIKCSQNTDSSTSSSSDDWESDEEDGKDIKYQPLPQDPIENGESLDVNNCSDDDRDEVFSQYFVYC